MTPHPHCADLSLHRLAPAPRLIIGLVGRAGAGKSTVARMLEDEYNFVHLALADPIVNMVGALFDTAGVDGAWMVERALKERPTTLGVSYRHLAQTLGTEWGRNVLGQDFWLRVLATQVNSPSIEHDSIVVSDVRFPNEADWIKAQGGHLVHIVRPGADPVRAHESEQHIDQIQAHRHIWNAGSLATLADQVDLMMAQLRRAADLGVPSRF